MTQKQAVKVILVRLPQTEYKKVASVAKEKNVSVNMFVRSVLRDYCDISDDESLVVEFRRRFDEIEKELQELKSKK